MAEFENVAIDVSAKDIEYVAKRPLLTGSKAPTASTSGELKQLYCAITEKAFYLCTHVQTDNMKWEKIAEYVDTSDFVKVTRTIAGLSLSENILTEDLAEALSVANVVVETKSPTPNNGDENTFWIDTTTNSLYYCDKRTLSGYNWIEIASGGGGTFEETDPTVPDWAKAENPPNATIRKLDSYPTSSTVGKVGEIALTTVEKTSGNTFYLAEVLVMCYLNPSDGLYFWKELSYVNSLLSIAGLRLNKDITVNDLITALNALTKADIADEVEFDDEGNLTNGDKIASVKCVHDAINFMAEEFGEKLELKAEKSYVDNLVGDVETALDNIIAIQENLIGGVTE